MNDIILKHFADTCLIRDTKVSHGTDAIKVKVFLAVHTTDVQLRAGGLVTHSTDACKLGVKRVLHATDSFKVNATSTTAATTATATATTAAATTGKVLASTTPEISKNASSYLDIGGGLSIIAGLLRIPTWNTAGRPKNPKAGTTGLNTETLYIEIWDGKIWHAVPTDQV